MVIQRRSFQDSSGICTGPNSRLYIGNQRMAAIGCQLPLLATDSEATFVTLASDVFLS